jgi:hypothetical protein
MHTRIFAAIEPVRRRQRELTLIRWAALGLLASSLAGIALGVWRWVGPPASQVAVPWLVALLASGPLAGALLGLARGRGWGRAAAAVDARYGLKDRTVTAVDFVQRPGSTPLHELQVDDAEQHLAQVDPRRVVPFRVPVALPWSLAACSVALVLSLWPRPGIQAAPLVALDEVRAAADDALASVEDLEEVANNTKDPELQKLVKQLIQKIEEMKAPGVDVKEALAKLSEMQTAITAQQALYNVGLVDSQMHTLGDALASTQALEAAGNNLQQAKYDKAAQALEQADPQFDRKEAKALREKLQKAAQAMGDAGLGELSEATTELLESIEDGTSSQGACRKLGNLARAHGRRKQISDLLTLQSMCLSECKNNCNKNSTAKVRQRKKSTNPSTNWGMGVSGNVDGEKTALDAERQRENIQGQEGEGPSETETTHSPEGRQAATRQYRDLYQKYRKRTEAALNSEPIPLGHRQTIRRYFELIRPDGEEAAKVDAQAQPAPGH